MTMCPNSKAACECQPQDGVICPHGPTPNDWLEVASGPTEHPCALCNGRGFYGIPGQRCTFCRGTGKTKAWRPADDTAGVPVVDGKTFPQNTPGAKEQP